MKMTVEIEVRFADLDAYGHVNNAVYFTYLETARVKLFRTDFVDLISSGVLFLVVEASCRYHLPIQLGDRVLIEITSESLGRTSFTLGYRLHNSDGKDFASARTVMVCFDQGRGKTVALPDNFRAGLQSLTDPA